MKVIWIKLFMPYEKGISEKISSLRKRYNVKVIHTKNKSLKNIVSYRNEERGDKKNSQGVVYKINCRGCLKSYIGKQEEC